MTTNADIGHGSSLGIYNGSTYDDLAEVTSITPPGYTRDAIDATHMASPNDFREYIAGMMDAGECEVEINYVPSASDAVIAAMIAGPGAASGGQFQITFPNSVTWTFQAIVTSYQPGAPDDDKMTASVTFKITGKPTLA